MKPFILCLLMAATTPGYTLGATQGQAGKLDPELFTRLREHLTTAIGNATLSDSQAATLRAAGETLRKASEARKSGQSVDRAKLKEALDDIKQVLESDAFRAEDVALVKADLDAIRKAAREAAKGGRRPRRRGLRPAEARSALEAHPHDAIETVVLTTDHWIDGGARS